jgi:hypothetical protein
MKALSSNASITKKEKRKKKKENPFLKQNE